MWMKYLIMTQTQTEVFYILTEKAETKASPCLSAASLRKSFEQNQRQKQKQKNKHMLLSSNNQFAF